MYCVADCRAMMVDGWRKTEFNFGGESVSRLGKFRKKSFHVFHGESVCVLSVYMYLTASPS